VYAVHVAIVQSLQTDHCWKCTHLVAPCICRQQVLVAAPEHQEFEHAYSKSYFVVSFAEFQSRDLSTDQCTSWCSFCVCDQVVPYLTHYPNGQKYTKPQMNLILHEVSVEDLVSASSAGLMSSVRMSPLRSNIHNRWTVFDFLSTCALCLLFWLNVLKRSSRKLHQMVRFCILFWLNQSIKDFTVVGASQL